MKAYTININSIKRGVITALVLLPVTIKLLLLIPADWHDLLHFVAVLLIYSGLTYIVTLISRARVRVELTNHSIKIIWIRRFILSWERDAEIPWQRVIDYVHQIDRGMDTIKLTLTNGEELRLQRYSFFPQRDDFSKLLAEFPLYIANIENTSGIVVEEGKTDFQSISWVLVILCLIALGALVYALIILDFTNAWLLLVMVLLGAVLYWVRQLK